MKIRFKKLREILVWCNCIPTSSIEDTENILLRCVVSIIKRKIRRTFFFNEW